ncbi:MAG TPA: helix-turn-helix domain-containing protein [Steroidobacteraceae bacterium]|nr:helix-turn-helix domain-containing protein [Steroidobacteraceae bacterium]
MNAALSLLCIVGCALGMLLISTLLMQLPRTRANVILAFAIGLASVDVLFCAAQHLSQQPTASGLLHWTRFPGLLFMPVLCIYFAVQAENLRGRCSATEQWSKSVRSALPARPHGHLDAAFSHAAWARLALIAGLAAYLFSAACDVLIAQISPVVADAADAIVSFTLILLAWLAAYRTKANGYPAPSEQAESKQEPEPKKQKYGNNRLPEFLRVSIIAELNRYMHSAQPWLQIDLTLSQLAASINVNPHHLSQIINSEFGKSFAGYINDHRVNAACQLLIGRRSKTVLDIALESGFSSKSSFNAVFKRHTGITPSEYRRKYYKKDCLVA